jgi:hypothetical protein
LRIGVEVMERCLEGVMAQWRDGRLAPDGARAGSLRTWGILLPRMKQGFDLSQGRTPLNRPAEVPGLRERI